MYHEGVIYLHGVKHITECVWYLLLIVSEGGGGGYEGAVIHKDVRYTRRVWYIRGDTVHPGC